MSNKLRVRKEMRKLLHRKEDKRNLISGELGATIGGQQRVKVPGRNGFVYVRLRGNDSEIIQAFNDKVNAVYGLPVLVTRVGNVYHVVSRDLGRYQEWGGVDGASQLGPHGAQHSFGGKYGSGGDVVWVFKRQFMPLLMYPYSGMTVSVAEEWYLWQEDYNHFTGSHVNLTGMKPTGLGDARFVTIYLDGDANGLAGITGSVFSSEPFPSNLDDYIPIVHYSAGIPVGAVLLTQQTTSIGWSDLYDIRPLFAGYPGGGGGGNLLIYDNGVFVVTGAAISFDDNLRVTAAGSTAHVSWTGTAGHVIHDEGTPINQRPVMDFRGAGVVATDNPTSNRTSITIPGTINIFDDNAFKTSGTAISFNDGLIVHVTGTIAYVDITGSFGHTIQDDGVSETQRANLNFVGDGFAVYDDVGNNATVISGTASGGGGNDIAIYDNGVEKTSSVTAIDFLDNIDVNMSGTVAYISLDMTTGSSTYFRAGVPNCIDGGGVTGTYWQVPDKVYATGSMTVFVNGVSQILDVDYQYQFPSSGTYQYLQSIPTGSLHFAVWGVPVPVTAGSDVIASDPIWEAKGDLVVGTGNNTAVKLPVGDDGTVLMANSDESAGIKWDMPFYPCDGRLTLTSGTVVITTGTVDNASIIYFTPYKGNSITLYDGSNWRLHNLEQISLNTSGMVSGTCHDIFIYNDAGELTLESLAWTNSTSRATELSSQDGIYIKSGDASRRYLGTIYLDTDNYTDNSLTKRYIWNYYNRVKSYGVKLDSTAHAYTTSSYRYWNNDSSQVLYFIIGVVEDTITLLFHTNHQKINAGPGLNTAASAQFFTFASAQTVHAGIRQVYPRLGYNYVTSLEIGYSSGYAWDYRMEITIFN